MKKLNNLIFDLLDWFFERFSGLMILLFCVFLVIMILYALLPCDDDASVKISLKNWECSESRTYTTTTPIPSGKALIPMVQYHNECVEYKRK